MAAMGAVKEATGATNNEVTVGNRSGKGCSACE
jgi:hypothetical protein